MSDLEGFVTDDDDEFIVPEEVGIGDTGGYSGRPQWWKGKKGDMPARYVVPIEYTRSSGQRIITYFNKKTSDSMATTLRMVKEGKHVLQSDGTNISFVSRTKKEMGAGGDVSIELLGTGWVKPGTVAPSGKFCVFPVAITVVMIIGSIIMQIGMV